MILVDTSVWIDHLRSVDNRLMGLLDEGQVLAHAFVIGELALGNLRQRKAILRLLLELPQVTSAQDDEVHAFIDANALWGLGIGIVDAHLLAAARLSNTMLWTHDKRLHGIAAKIGLAAVP